MFTINAKPTQILFRFMILKFEVFKVNKQAWVYQTNTRQAVHKLINLKATEVLKYHLWR